LHDSLRPIGFVCPTGPRRSRRQATGGTPPQVHAQSARRNRGIGFVSRGRPSQSGLFRTFRATDPGPTGGIGFVSHDTHRPWMVEWWGIPAADPAANWVRVARQAPNWVCFARLAGAGPRWQTAGQASRRRSFPIRNRGIGFVLSMPWPVQFTIIPFLHSTCPSYCSGANWLCFARSARQIRFISHDGPSSRVPQAASHPAGGIGFVSHDSPRRNWVRFLRNCLAAFAPQAGSHPASARIGFVLHGKPWQIGFVSQVSRSAGRRAGVPPQLRIQSAIHLARVSASSPSALKS
jgi:hypothetical protein